MMPIIIYQSYNEKLKLPIDSKLALLKMTIFLEKFVIKFGDLIVF